MFLPVEVKRLVFCVVVILTPSYVKGLCETNYESNVCSTCVSLTLSQDCCTDSNAYAICDYCFHDPQACEDIDNILEELDSGNDIFERYSRSGSTDDDESLPVYYPPQRRAKYFLGKRSSRPSGKRLKNNFLGKRESWYTNELDKRGRPFLGKRVGLRPFLGKRFDSDYLAEDKRMRPFLGKRDTSALDSDIDESNSGVEDDLEKRNRPFLGKRDDNIDEKRNRPFLGKRGDDDDVTEKRARPFLGKRGDEPSKRLRPFLGKRTDDIDEDKRMRPFLGKRQDDKRMRPFLGKRSRYDLLNEIEKRNRPFLGKRSELEKRETRNNRKSSYMQPFARRAKYFLGKRDGANKRPKYFLGKRTVDVSGIEHQEQKHFLDQRSTS